MDNPSALHNEFREDLNMSEVEFMNLYAWYSWPNVVLSFVGGFLIDKAIDLNFFFFRVRFLPYRHFEEISISRRNSNGTYRVDF